MSLVASLLTALVRADGDALVLHTGECPYVVSPTGQTELASRVLTLEVMTGAVVELLPPDAREALDTLGAVQHDLRPPDGFTGERFTVVAARGGDDIWVEIRRHRTRARSVPASQPSQANGLERLLRVAAERGASTVYLTSNGRPTLRVEGEIRAIEGEGVLSEPDVQALILKFVPERNLETLWSQAGREWVRDVPGVGRVRCITFTDHRGAGGIFRMVPERAISSEQLGLSSEIKDLCAEAQGLVLVAGPRASGKSTLMAAFVDVVNRTRSEHVITLEEQITFVHVNRGSLISQREVRGNDADLLAAAQTALRENPDVLVIENLGSPGIAMLALEAAKAGRLVIGALTACTASDAVDRFIGQAPPDRRPTVRSALAEHLRGIVSQLLLRKTRGGWVAAREVLLNTRAVGDLIADGNTSQLPATFNETIAGLVRAGIVDSREAYRQAPDKPGLRALLG